MNPYIIRKSGNGKGKDGRDRTDRIKRSVGNIQRLTSNVEGPKKARTGRRQDWIKIGGV
jgi:hypothetical protein